MSLATREAVLSDDLEQLESERDRPLPANARRRNAPPASKPPRLRMKAIRRIIHYLRAPGSQRIGGLSMSAPEQTA